AVSRSFRDRALAICIINRLVSPHHNLRTILRRGVEQVAFVHRLVEAPVTGQTFSIQGGHEQVAAGRGLPRAILKNVVVNGLPLDSRLRRQWPDMGNLAKSFAE